MPRSKEEILADVNADLPPGVDWKAGARRYVAGFFSDWGREATERYVTTKPMTPLPPEAHDAPLAEFAGYTANFLNTVKTLNLPGGTTWLDVACGGGWFSHYLTKLGYKAYGFDIAADFIELARRRLRDDPALAVSESDLRERFFVHDLEEAPLPARLQGTFDVVVFESCVHHFFDPVAALTHTAQVLKLGGIAVLIEGENRTGPIREEYMKVMRETDTLERPYPRSQLEEILQAAGLTHYEFVAPLNGFYSPKVWNAHHLEAHLNEVANGTNYAFAAKSAEALRRVFPWRR